MKHVYLPFPYSLSRIQLRRVAPSLYYSIVFCFTSFNIPQYRRERTNQRLRSSSSDPSTAAQVAFCCAAAVALASLLRLRAGALLRGSGGARFASPRLPASAGCAADAAFDFLYDSRRALCCAAAAAFVSLLGLSAGAVPALASLLRLPAGAVLRGGGGARFTLRIQAGALLIAYGGARFASTTPGGRSAARAAALASFLRIRAGAALRRPGHVRFGRRLRLSAVVLACDGARFVSTTPRGRDAARAAALASLLRIRAGAVLCGSGGVRFVSTHPGFDFQRRRVAAAARAVVLDT